MRLMVILDVLVVIGFCSVLLGAGSPLPSPPPGAPPADGRDQRSAERVVSPAVRPEGVEGAGVLEHEPSTARLTLLLLPIEPAGKAARTQLVVSYDGIHYTARIDGRPDVQVWAPGVDVEVLE